MITRWWTALTNDEAAAVAGRLRARRSLTCFATADLQVVGSFRREVRQIPA